VREISVMISCGCRSSVSVWKTPKDMIRTASPQEWTPIRLDYDMRQGLYTSLARRA